MDLARIPVIDVDTHYTEPPDLWSSRAPAALKDTAPRVVERAGKLRWVVDRDLELGPPGFCVVRPDGSKLRGRWTLPTFEEMTPAATDPAARLATMDELGLHTQILYPNILGFAGNHIMRVKDEALRNFCITGYNDAMGELHEAGGGRLRPQALLPFWDVELAVRELVRCHEELHLTGLTLTDSPELWKLPTLSEPYWDPLWDEAQQRGLPVNFHIGSGGFGGGTWRMPDSRRNLAALSTLAQMNNMRCLVNLIFSGLLDRYPRLNFVSVESGLGWIPFLLEAAEYQDTENAAGLALKPREYFQRQIYASYWFERDGVSLALQWLGEDNIMFETDFPHPTCLYPGVQEQIEATLGDQPERVQRKVLHGNAARVYGLPIPD